MPENTQREDGDSVNNASSTCTALKRKRAMSSPGCQRSRQRMTQQPAAVSENTHQDCVERPRPSSSHSVKRSGECDQRPSSHAMAMNTTSSPQ